MSERVRQMTGGHRCEHGMQRATAQSTVYAGAVRTCTCCRSGYGANQMQSQLVDLCIGCGGTKDTHEWMRERDRALQPPSNRVEREM